MSRARKARMMRLVSPQIDVESERSNANAEIKLTQWDSPNRIVTLELDDYDLVDAIRKFTAVLKQRRIALDGHFTAVREETEGLK